MHHGFSAEVASNLMLFARVSRSTAILHEYRSIKKLWNVSFLVVVKTKKGLRTGAG